MVGEYLDEYLRHVPGRLHPRSPFVTIVRPRPPDLGPEGDGVPRDRSG